LTASAASGAPPFFCEHLASGGGDARVDLLAQCVIEQRDGVPQGLMAEAFGVLTPQRGGHAEHLAHERVVVGDMFQPIPVRVEAEPHHAQDEDLPEVQAGAAGGLLAGEDFGFQQGEDLGLERGVRPNPLEAGQNRGPFGAALERQAHRFDGGDLEIGLGLEGVAQGVKGRRMSQVQTTKPAQTFNRHANIRTVSPAPNSTLAGLFRVERRTLTIDWSTRSSIRPTTERRPTPA
jgi:hypothetical protein